jgi:tight adherence protein B
VIAMSGIDPYYLAFVGIFIGALLAFEGLRQFLSRGAGETARSRRMRMIEAGASPGEVLQLLKPPEGSGWLSRLPLVSDLPQRLGKAGIAMRPELFVLLCVAGGAALYFLAYRMAGPVAAPGAAVAGAILVPVAVIEAARRKRMDKLITQLPDALDLMSRGLRVGHPLNATIASVAEEMPDPIGTEFGIMVDQISYGDELVTAFREMAERTGEEDLHYLAVAVGIQHGTGGNLARLLNVLAKVIRDRATMRRKIKAISAEGRGSMWILSSLPPLIFGIVTFMTPSFYGAIKDDPLYTPIMVIIIILVVANFLALRKLVNFRF